MLTPVSSFLSYAFTTLESFLITFRFESVVDSSTTGTWSLSLSFDGLSIGRCNARSEARLYGDKSPASRLPHQPEVAQIWLRGSCIWSHELETRTFYMMIIMVLGRGQ